MMLAVKNPSANAGDVRDSGSIPGLGRPLGGGNGNPLQYSFLENSHGQRSLVGYSPRGHKELYMTEHTHCYITKITFITKATDSMAKNLKL